MDPFTLIAGAVSIGSSIAGIFNSVSSRGNTALGSYYSQIGGLMQSNAQASAAEANAETALQQARYVVEQGRVKADLQYKEGERAIGGIKAGYGASGVTQDSGSAQDVLAESTRNINFDHYTILHNAQVQSDQLKRQAALYQQEADNSRQAGMIGFLAAANMGSAAMNQSTGAILGQIGQASSSAYSMFKRK